MDDGAYQRALFEKLVEEAREVSQAEGGELIKELAELFKVIDAVLDKTGISRQDIEKRQRARREE